MPKPCSLELRERVVEAIASGASRREAAEWFAVTGSISPLEAHADFLLVLIAGQPDFDAG